MVRKNISKNTRHILWNWEKSPDHPEHVRYHFVIVDDKLRKATLDEIMGQLTRVRSGIVEVRRLEGSVPKSGLRYLLCSFDSETGPQVLRLDKIGKPYRKEDDLYERKVGKIEDWVSNHYSAA